jgi:hypothetical protein
VRFPGLDGPRESNNSNIKKSFSAEGLKKGLITFLLATVQWISDDGDQGDRIVRIFAYWISGYFFDNYKSSQSFRATYFRGKSCIVS